MSHNTFTLQTLGCRVNQYESSYIIEALAQADCRLVGSQPQADITIVHSCAVTSRASFETRQLLRRARRSNPDGLVIAMGCDANFEWERMASEGLATHILGNREKFDLSSNRIFEGIISVGVVLSEDGKIELKGRGKAVFEAAISEDAKRLIKARLEEKGFPAEFAEDFKRQQWMKLFANAVINPITALTREKNGIVLSPHLEGVVSRIVGECVAVAEEEGHRFNEGEVLEFVRSVAEMTATNSSSMLQDVLRGRSTEIDSINGYVLGRAAKHALEAPANEMLYSLVKSIEKER